QMRSMGWEAASPKVLSPPFGSRQKPEEAWGKKGALVVSAIFPPPPAHAAGLAVTGGGGGAPRGSSPLLPAARAVESAIVGATPGRRRSCLVEVEQRFMTSPRPSTFFHSVAIVSARAAPGSARSRKNLQRIPPDEGGTALAFHPPPGMHHLSLANP